MQWLAAMITPAQELAAAPILRTEFALEAGHGPVASALLSASSFGIFEATVNGVPVSDEVLSPGWSSYEWRVRFRTYDVTRLLRPRSVLGILLGNGWYRGRLGWTGARCVYGDRLGAIAQLDVTFADGHVQTVLTSDAWLAGPSEITSDDLYDGQTVDARRRDRNWTRPGADLSTWAPVEVLPFDTSRLTPYVGPPVRRQETLAPTRVWTSPAGNTLFDFGQNLVGWLRLEVRGSAGTEIAVRHAEVLENGELAVRPLRSAQATDRYVLSGELDVFEPTLTFHGFRFAEISGWNGDLDSRSVEAVVVHSDLARTGYFTCSDPLLNQLHSNVVWGLKGNFLDLPTDCPQRDERLGWTGDIAVFAPSAAFLFDVREFLRDWLHDLSAEQSAAGGRVPYVVPDALKLLPEAATDFAHESTAIWGDAAVWVPWSLWLAYGDRQVLQEQYTSMASHARRVESLLSPSGLWDSGFQFGDWLDPQAPPNDPFTARADSSVVATACAYRTARIVSEAAALLGDSEDSRRFAHLSERLRAAFRLHYVRHDGTVTSDAPTVYALAIAFGLLDEETSRLAGERLAQLVAENGFRVATGFAGTAYVTDALTVTGHLTEAYRLLLETECPSWLYPVTMGATTIWERWDSMLPDGTVNPGEMTSFNHYALGAVADWIHRVVGGIAPLQPGYSRVLIAPRPGGGLTWAESSLETPHGRVRVRWEQGQDEVTVHATIPPGVAGLIDLPGRQKEEVGDGTHRRTFRPQDMVIAGEAP
ncbi:alpha-L-rhamnosidase [Motilibacter rhizosphaerae]|uniref:alpha-L-rhamnosidase n=1 Tax=Motilibacter rhizosphaerae TaxID=598652 RepID=A0A4Q7NW65_9ACTN|nr:family 78 glycoside hydrolase catalytic domain [Motilibacter rhizosphaerae]RZS91138.1 alpha-L-rhamnosidase [Motilibacter rhizosphaerae]